MCIKAQNRHQNLILLANQKFTYLGSFVIIIIEPHLKDKIMEHTKTQLIETKTGLLPIPISIIPILSIPIYQDNSDLIDMTMNFFENMWHLNTYTCPHLPGKILWWHHGDNRLEEIEREENRGTAVRSSKGRIHSRKRGKSTKRFLISSGESRSSWLK